MMVWLDGVGSHGIREMKNRTQIIGGWLIVFLAGCFLGGIAHDARGVESGLPLRLPAPRTGQGKPLMQCLNERESSREFSPVPLDPQVLSDLLWAAFGINRADSGKRTAPSTVNARTIGIYVAKSDGLFRYDADGHALLPIHDRDVRGLTGGQEYVSQAPVSLIFVADFERLDRFPESERLFYAAADTGFISQNVYLFSASENLATVVHAVTGAESLREALELRPGQKPLLAQCVGNPR